MLRVLPKASVGPIRVREKEHLIAICPQGWARETRNQNARHHLRPHQHCDRGQDVENQLRQLREFCQHQDWELVHEYIDRDTGSKSDRTQLQAMMLAASQGKADVLLFWALDRLSREGAFETLQYLNLLTSYGVGFRSYSELYLDSCGVFKEAVVSILATIAKQERIRLGERVKAGMARAREQGVRFGRPGHGADVRRIFDLRRSGASLRAIARRVGISEASVRRSLKSRP